VWVGVVVRTPLHPHCTPLLSLHRPTTHQSYPYSYPYPYLGIALLSSPLLLSSRRLELKKAILVCLHVEAVAAQQPLQMPVIHDGVV
jgi:hypothetical protein